MELTLQYAPLQYTKLSEVLVGSYGFTKFQFFTFSVQIAFTGD